MLRATTLLNVLLVGLLALLSLNQVGAASTGTTIWINVGPEGGYINDLAIDPQNTNIFYAGTYGGGVFKSTNGGGNWSAVNTGLTNASIFALVQS